MVRPFKSCKWNTHFHLFRSSVYSGNFPVEQTKQVCPFTSQPEFPEFLGKWKTPLDTRSYFLPATQSERASDSIQPIKIRDVTAVFPYSHLNTDIDQRECTYYPNYVIKNTGPHIHQLSVLPYTRSTSNSKARSSFSPLSSPNPSAKAFSPRRDNSST